MADKLFKSSMFGGYKKREVDAHVATLQAQTVADAKQIEALHTEIAGLKEQLGRMEKERAFIADALLNAKKEAERMLSEASAKIDKMQAEAEAELNRLRALAEDERSRILTYQKDAEELLRAHKERVDSIKL